MFYVSGWNYGEDVEPPEPGKRWLTVEDEEGNEVCTFVQRQRSRENEEPSYLKEDAIVRQANATFVCDALNVLSGLATVAKSMRDHLGR